MKKFLLAAALVTFLFGSVVPVLAVPTTGAEQPKHGQFHKGEQHKCGLETIIKDSLQKNNRDLSKVKQDLDKLFADQKVKHEAKLAELAKQKGVSVEELKNQFAQKRQQRFEKWAAEKGVTPEQLKQNMQQKQQARMEQLAKDVGLTPEQLKQILPEKPAK